MRQGKDSTNWRAIPADTEVVMGYVPPSRFAWPPAAWAKFANSVKARITPNAAMHGPGINVLDVETGDATAAQVPGWCIASRQAKQEPTVYTAIGNWAACVQSCLAVGVAMPQWWIAEWDGVQTLPALTMNGVTYRAVAKQYADPAHGSGGDWDSSIVADYWPGVDPAPPTPSPEADMPSYNRTCNAGTNEHADLCVAGASNLYLSCSYTQTIQVWDLLFYGDTPAEPAPATTGVGGGYASEDHGGAAWQIDPNRPGPITVPPGAVSCTLRYDAGHDFDMAAS